MQAFAGAVKAAYPNHLRLSIHQSTGEHKISLSLLNTKTGFTTPWHCSVALMATGEWLSAPKGDLEQDTTLSVVEEDGRPSFFRQEITPSEQNDKEAQVPVSPGIFTGDITGQEPTNQYSSHGNDTLVGVRTSKGSSTAETTQSNSSQDTSPIKCEAALPEASQPQNKGTKSLTPNNYHFEVADRFKVGCSVGSSERSLACNTNTSTFALRSRLVTHSRPPKMHTALNVNQEAQKQFPLLLHDINVVKCNISHSFVTISQTISYQLLRPLSRPPSPPIRDSSPYPAASRARPRLLRKWLYQCRDTLAP